jgi:hypothetical protein
MIPFPKLSNARKGTRANRSSMIVPMGERWDMKGGIEGLVSWMDVEHSTRWLPRMRADGSVATYCDHAAADFLDQFYGAGVVPFPAWVWWTPDAIRLLSDGEEIKPILHKTARELGAPSLHRWLSEDSWDYGWVHFSCWQDLQDHCNKYDIPGVIATARHVAIVRPEERSIGRAPFTWQAGVVNSSGRRVNDWFYRFPTTVFAAWHGAD